MLSLREVKNHMIQDINGNQTQPKQQGVTLKQTTEVVCDECKSVTFNESFMLRKVSRILTGQPKDTYVPIPLFTCTSCGHVNEEFYPAELKLEKASPLIS